MAYSRSEETLRNRAHLLEGLMRGEEQAWLVEEGRAHDWAYKVRECLFIARLPGVMEKPEFRKISEAASVMTVEVVGSNKVQARRAKNTPEAMILTGAQHVSPTHGLETAGRSIATAGPQSPFTIIDAWRKHAQGGSSNTPLHFSQAALDQDQLRMLWNWAQGWKPRLMLMVDGPSVTVGPVEKDVEAYSWHPPEVGNDGSSAQAPLNAKGKILPGDRARVSPRRQRTDAGQEIVEDGVPVSEVLDEGDGGVEAVQPDAPHSLEVPSKEEEGQT